MKRNHKINWHADPALAQQARGKRVAIVGGTGGIGRALARHLAALGAEVTVVGQTFRDAGVPHLQFLPADLSLMREARRVAADIPAESLDLLILTTGIFAAPRREQTSEGLERDLAVSYLSRLAVLQSVVPRLGIRRPPASPRPRVFLMGYPGSGQIGAPDDLNSERSYKPMPAHMNTVAGNEALVLDYAKRCPEAAFFGLNPGIIKTGIRDNFLGKGSLKSRLIETVVGWLTPTADAYAARITPLLFAPDIEDHSGAMFNNKGLAILPSAGMTEAHIAKFMLASDALLLRAGQSATQA